MQLSASKFPAGQNCLRVTGVMEYTIPMFGNRQALPYGKLEVTDGEYTKVCPIRFNKKGERYITFKRKRKYVKNVGTLYNPKFEIVQGKRGE